MKYLKIGLPIVSLSIVLISFQNCGKTTGFQLADGADAKLLGLDSSSNEPDPTASPTVSPTASPTASPTPTPTATGPAAKILILNPFAASGNRSLPYNTNYTSLLTNANLSGLTDTAVLGNANFAVNQDDAFPTQIAKPSESLVFTADNPKFAQVNLYYQIQSFVSNLVAGSIFPSNFVKLGVNAHCQQGANSFNNAFYSSSSNLLCMGNSTINGTTVYSAFDADVAVHEFGHAVNHKTSSDAVLNSTTDMGALDEGYADVWAYLNNGSPYIGEWYGAAIVQNITGSAVTPYNGLRDLSTTPVYPGNMVSEIHVDSTPISTIYYELNKLGVDKAVLRKLASRVLSDLQVGDNFGDVSRYVVEEAQALNINASMVMSVLNKRGMYRKDNMAQVTAADSDVTIIDNHAYSFMKNGNCNGKLDAGETVLMVVNVKNSGSALGAIRSFLNPGTKLKVSAGFEYGTFFLLDANSSYLKSLGRFTSARAQEQVLYAAYLVTAPAGTTGTASVNVNVSGFDSIDATPSTKNLTLNIPVGSVANVTGKCSGTGETAVWPKYQ